MELNKACVIDTSQSQWKKLSDKAKDLLLLLLKKDPEERITSANALEHPWFLDEEEQEVDLGEAM
ncbi:hypothetical protein COB52_00240 [Candidatus Kaiserbacteria bacterium]|nr:MAG: hypothetical protein COB52_00240 [Candidatus Kaiserbacteria bacterium]